MLPQIGSAEEAQYTAMVMEITGKVSVSSEKGKKPLYLGGLLCPGDKVEIDRNATITINYVKSGEEEKWPGGLTFTIGKAQSSPIDSRVIRQYRPIHHPTNTRRRDLDGDRIGGSVKKSMVPPKQDIEEMKDTKDVKENSTDSPDSR